ncbi:MAG: PIG-L family deacetylase [Candidatus Jordarchaeaceae archaeon]
MFFSYERDAHKVAVISAHPDDETLGAGGTLVRHKEIGDEIHACIVTKGYTPDWSEEEIEEARKQAENALEILGASSVHFLGFPTVKLNVVPGKELHDKIKDFIESINPDIIYAPFYGDLNSDHQIVARTVAIAARPVPNNRRTILYFETLSSTEWGRMFQKMNFIPNIYVDISKTIEKKIEAVRCYRLELKEYPHPRSIEGIKTLARFRGMESGLDMAEAFMLAFHVL